MSPTRHLPASPRSGFRRLLASPRRALALLLATVGTSLPAQLFWDASGVGVPAGGSGTWDLSLVRWTWNSGLTYETWVPSMDGGSYLYNSEAAFGGTAGTVTVTDAIGVGGLDFRTSGYILAASGAGAITLDRGGLGFGPIAWVRQAGHVATITAPLAGSNGLLASGPGTLVLAGANTFTGNLVITGATVRVLSATGSINSANSLRFAAYTYGPMGGGTFILDNTGAAGATTQSFADFEAGGGDVTIRTDRVTAQNLTLSLRSYSGSNRFPGATVNFIVNGGVNGTENRIRLPDADAGFIDVGHFFGGGNYAWVNSTGKYVREINYGVDADTATTSGGLTLPAASHVEATGTITAQTDLAVTSLKLGSSADIAIAPGSALTLNGVLKTGGGSATISGGDLQPGAYELHIRTDTAADSLTISSIIRDLSLVNLTKSGAGTLTLTADNTFAGSDFGSGTPATSIFLNGGVLSVPSFPATAGTASPIGLGGLQFTGGNLRYTGAASVTTTRVFQFFGGGGGIEITQPGAVLTLNSAVPGSGSSVTSDFLVKSGPGTLSLAGSDGNGGLGAIVNGGTLLLAKTSGATAVGALTINSGTVRYAGSSTAQIDKDANVVVNTGSTLDFNGKNAAFGFLSGTGGLLTNTSTSANSIVTIGGFNGFGPADFSGAITDGSSKKISLIKSGPHTQVLSGANTYTGNTTLTGGMLQIGNGGTSGSLASPNLISNTSESTIYSEYPTYLVVAFNRSDAVTYAGNISGPARLVQMGTGTLTLTGAASTFTGNTTIKGGMIAIAADTKLGAAPSSTTADALTLDGGSLRGTATFTLTTKRGVTLGAAGGGFAPDVSTTLTYGGIITGAGNLTQSGAGTLVLSGTNTYTGTTTLSAGTLSLAADRGLGATPGAVAANALTFNGGSLQATASFTLASNRGLTLAAGGGTLSPDSTKTLTYGGVIAGSGGLTKSGAGTVTLSGVNTYSGGTTISAGQLTLSGSGTFGSTSGSLTLSGGTLDLGTLTRSTGAVTFTSGTLQNGTLTGASYDARGGTVSAKLGGTGALTKTTTGSLTLSGSNTYTGLTTVSEGTLIAAANNALGTTAGGTVVSSGGTIAFQGGINYTTGETLTISGTGASSRNGALDNLTGSNTFAGSILLAGTAKIGAVTNTALTLSGAIGESGGAQALTFGGPGNVTLSGTNTYTGGTTISGGNVTVSSAGTLAGAAGGLTLSGGKLVLNNTSQTIASLVGTGGTLSLGSGHTLTVNQSATTAFSGTISGAGGLVKSGTGTLSLSNASYTGATLVSGGRLNLTGTIGSLTVASGGMFSPGNSPGLTTVNGNLVLSGLTLMEISGLTRGATSNGYDAFEVTGSATLGGTLQVTLLNGFTPVLGNSFDFINAASTSGSFGTLSLPALSSGLAWNTSALSTTGVISVVASAIPEPSTYAMLAGACALGLAAYRRRRANGAATLTK